MSLKFTQSLLTVVTLSTLANAVPSFAADSVQIIDSATKKAADLFQHDKLQEAIDIEEQVAKEKPKDWIPAATLSYFFWQQGNVIAAAEQGEIAVKLAPHAEIALLNLAKIKEALDDCKGAIPLYEEAKVVAPGNWVPWLGLARCYVKSGQESKGLEVLAQMNSQTQKNFSWYQELGDTYLRLDKPALAVEATTKANKLAKTPEENAASSNQLLLALIRNNQVDEAKALQKKVFETCHPNEYELYVRASVALLPADDPASGKALLHSAEENLKTPDDGEGFFRLGKVFEQKATNVASNPDQFAAWMECAAGAYRQAIALNTQQPAIQAKYHVALVGVLEREGNVAGMKSELSTAKALDQFSQLAPYLLRYTAAELPAADTASKQGTASIKNHCNVNLTKADFRINGLNCGCQITKAEEAIGKIEGVGFVHVAANVKPYEGTMLVDEKVVSLKDVFAKAAGSFREFYAKMNPPVVADYELISKTPVTSIEDAVQVAQFCEHGDVLKFFNAFKPVNPVMPLNQLATNPDSKTD